MINKVHVIDPSASSNKTLQFAFEYDSQGNLTENFRRGVGEGRVNEYFTYDYDELNRLTVEKMYSSKPNTTTNASPVFTRSYEYDSLGNLTYEQNVLNNNGSNKTVDYKHNSLNQMVQKYIQQNNNQNQSADKYYTYTYDNRGNLIKGLYHQNANQIYVDEQYFYDLTNRMVMGTNDIGETSEYVYNGFGELVKNVWTIKKGAYGYTGISTQDIIDTKGEDLLVLKEPPLPSNSKQKKTKDLAPANAQGASGPNKTSEVTKNYVLDYTSPLNNIIMESETLKDENGVGYVGFTYRYVYGLEKLSVLISPVTNGAGGLIENGKVKMWYHQDRLGSVDFMTDNIQGKVASYIDYDAWGMPLKKAVLKLSLRELDMAIEYTGHPYDSVLGIYYARARMYDAADRRFHAVDLIKGTVANPQTLNAYVYVIDNPIKYIDPTGLAATQTWVDNNGRRTIVTSNSSMFDIDPVPAYRLPTVLDKIDIIRLHVWLTGLDILTPEKDRTHRVTDDAFDPTFNEALRKFQEQYEFVYSLKVKNGTLDYATWAAIQKEYFKIFKCDTNIGLIFPIADAIKTFSSSFGYRPGGGDTDFHYGIDFRVTNVPVYAALMGKIKYTETNNSNIGRGNLIIIESGIYETWYQHLSFDDWFKKWDKGNDVAKGQRIATSGNTGTGGWHFHFELRINGVPVDPWIYLI